ncbi:MAG: dTDP-glucose 4,6-dehydratase [Clostridia bacterium]|nr:dTDP-glucose 4,6-dehydratase [Clostridia bacterium]
MTILITGGAGFIGINFIYYMMKNHPDYRIICLDKLTYASNRNALPSDDTSFFRFVKGDICDRALVQTVFEQEKPSVIVNFAGESHVDRSISEPSVFYLTNVLGTTVLLDACVKYGAHFHQVSTDEVYGDLPLDKPELFFTESSPLRPSSPYSASKASADLITLAYHRTYGLPVTISRSSNNYGFYQHVEKLIPKIISLALADEPLPVYGRGENVRDWLFVDDHCTGIDLILHKGRVGEIYNICGGFERSNTDVVATICRLLGKSTDLITFAPDRKGHDLRYTMDMSKINELGFTPKTKFDDGIKKTIEWYTKRTL